MKISLINIRKLAYDDAFNITNNWLNDCNKVRPLDFNASIKIKDALRAATCAGYLHIGFNDLKSENGELSQMLVPKLNDRWP